MKFWGKRIVIVEKTPAMSSDKLLECFAVDPDTPLLKGVLSVLAGIEEMGTENVSTCALKDSERTFYAGGISSMAEAQGRIIDLVKDGNAAKRGEGTPRRSGSYGGQARRPQGEGPRPGEEGGGRRLPE